jgi:hypothetical protein
LCLDATFAQAFVTVQNAVLLLTRHATVQNKVLTTLEGRFHLISLGYRCSRDRCPNARLVFVSPEPPRLSLKGLSFGFDLIVQIGWWRFGEHRTLDEIGELARAPVPDLSARGVISDRRFSLPADSGPTCSDRRA